MKFRKFYHFNCIIFLLIFPLILYSQEYNYATYNVKIDAGRFSKFLFEGKFNAFEKKVFKKMYNRVNRTDLSLTFKENKSVFKPINGMEIDDSKFSRLANGGLFIILGIEKATYLNLKTNTLYIKRGSGDIEHLIKKEISSYNWVLIPEEKKVKQFTYKKAILNAKRGKLEYKIEAWFCPEIPNQFGPDSFYGLPGLITEVYVTDKDFSYSIILKKIGYNKTLNISIPIENFKVYTQEESDELFGKLKKHK